MGVSDPMFTGDHERRIAELERQLRNLTSGRRLEDASVGARGITVRGGGSIVIDGGTLKLIDEHGVEVAYWGDVDFGGISRGWELNFATGSRAFSLGGTPGNQAWALWDNDGNYVATNDAATGVGLARPFVPMHIVPSPEAQTFGTSFYPSHTSSSFTRLWYGFNPIFHPRIQIGVSASTAGGGTARWRLLINGIDVTGEVTGPGSRTVDVPGWGDTITPDDTVELTLQGRIADGGSNVLLNVDKLFALES